MLQIPQIVGGVLARFPTILRAMAMPLILALALQAVIYIFVGPTPVTRQMAELPGGPPRLPLIVVAGALVVLWAYVMVPVRWHRYVIDGDHGFRWWTIPLGLREWRYLGWLALNLLIVGVITVVLGSVLSGLLLPIAAAILGPSEGLAIFVGIGTIALALLCWSLWMAAFGLVLPAAAVGRPIGFGYSSIAAVGFYWRFVARIGIMAVVGAVAAGFISRAGTLVFLWTGGSVVGSVADTAMDLVGTAVGLALSTSALSFNYGEAFEWADRQRHAAPGGA